MIEGAAAPARGLGHGRGTEGSAVASTAHWGALATLHIPGGSNSQLASASGLPSGGKGCGRSGSGLASAAGGGLTLAAAAGLLPGPDALAGVLPVFCCRRDGR